MIMLFSNDLKTNQNNCNRKQKNSKRGKRGNNFNRNISGKLLNKKTCWTIFTVDTENGIDTSKFDEIQDYIAGSRFGIHVQWENLIKMGCYGQKHLMIQNSYQKNSKLIVLHEVCYQESGIVYNHKLYKMVTENLYCKENFFLIIQ